MAHVSVLKAEAVDNLNLKTDSVVVDCTLGAGGHARSILHLLGEDGIFVGFDVDPLSVESSTDLMSYPATVHLRAVNFRHIKSELENLNLCPDAILADLGWRTEQFTEGEKGFSFQVDEPLLMTFGNPKGYQFTAHEMVNYWDEQSLVDILFGYGEEPGARRIAKAIVAERKNELIATSRQLADIVTKALPHHRRHGKIHAATKTFQAIRITVNDELQALETLIKDGFDCLKTDGRLAIISFHSLEDRVVKRAFRALAQGDMGRLVNKKPIVPSLEELKENRRSRSAKLRVIEKISSRNEN